MLGRDVARLLIYFNCIVFICFICVFGIQQIDLSSLQEYSISKKPTLEKLDNGICHL